MSDYVDRFDAMLPHANDSVAFPDGLRRRAYTRAGKRLFDLMLAVFLLPVLVPVIAILWFLTGRDGAPGFFGHMRVGRGGTPFKCWKIRTMVPDAEERLHSHLAGNPEAAAEWARDRKLTNDPRITAWGGFLRRTSLDELPQIWNVLRGDMSFVGPRPIVREELAKYGGAAPVYLAQTPGITGLWQVSGRNDVSYGERVQLDLQYARGLTFFLDLKIIWKTGVSVFRGTGK